jgi:hypothetical protein
MCSAHSKKAFEALVFGQTGESAGLFKSPTGLTINSMDVVYVSDAATNEIIRIYPGTVQSTVQSIVQSIVSPC